MLSLEFKDRLAKARREAGFDTPTEASRALGITTSTYLGYENGDRDPSRRAVTQIAEFYRVTLDWLIRGRGPMRRGARLEPVELVGLVSAGSDAVMFSEGQGNLGEVEAPAWANEKTVAVEVRGQSLGTLFDGWIIYYDDRRDPVTDDLIGHICVAGLSDGRVVVKRLERGQLPKRFNLLSNIEPPIYDARISWAAKVKEMRPR